MSGYCQTVDGLHYWGTVDGARGIITHYKIYRPTNERGTYGFAMVVPARSPKDAAEIYMRLIAAGEAQALPDGGGIGVLGCDKLRAALRFFRVESSAPTLRPWAGPGSEEA